MSVTGLRLDDPTLASRYLAGRLDDAERAAFEARFIEHPSVLRELEAAARMKTGLRCLQRRGELRRLVAGYREPGVMACGVAAAMAMLAIALGLNFPISDRSPPMAAQVSSLAAGYGKTLPIVSSHSLLRMRSIDADASVRLPSTRGAIELRVLSASARPYASYRLQLRRSAEAPAANVDASIIDAGADGWVTLYLDSQALSPGRYELDIAPANAEAEAESFVIDVRSDADSVP